MVGAEIPSVEDGLGSAQRAVLRALFELGATSNGDFIRTERVVARALGVEAVPSLEEFFGPGWLEREKRDDEDFTWAAFASNSDDLVANLAAARVEAEARHAATATGRRALRHYLALVPLTQDFSVPYPLVEGQGHFGSLDGGPPADPFYNECRLTSFAERLLGDSGRGAKLPMFLVLGSRKPHCVPPHRVDAVASACAALLRDDRAEFDLGTPCPPVGDARFVDPRSFARDGKGELLVSGRVAFDAERLALEIQALPWLTHTTTWHNLLADLIRLEHLANVEDFYDESDGDRFSLVLALGQREAPVETLARVRALLTVQYRIELRARADAEKDMPLAPRELLVRFVQHRVAQEGSIRRVADQLAELASFVDVPRR